MKIASIINFFCRRSPPRGVELFQTFQFSLLCLLRRRVVTGGSRGDKYIAKNINFLKYPIFTSHTEKRRKNLQTSPSKLIKHRARKFEKLIFHTVGNVREKKEVEVEFFRVREN